jgi:polysaccharide pyruvyl transferase WcaK-like protein
MCQSRGIDYTAILVDFIRERIENGTPVLLLPHAVRPGRPASRMNDIPLVRDIHGRVGSSRCVLIDDDLSPGTLRALIEGSSLLVTSRFHALISSLCVGTPPLVVGWSHKYEEVMNEIGLREWMIPHESLKPDLLRSRFLSLWDVREDVRSAIRARVSRLVDDAHESFRVVRDVVAASVGGAA